MSPEKKARSNAQRTDRTRAALLSVARAHFVAQGYAGAATPEIVAEAGVTRGALYHHFSGKTDLFRAVVTAEAAAVADEIAAAAPGAGAEALASGAAAYFDAMDRPGRVRLLLIDGPAVLGPDEMRQIDGATGGGTLRDGLAPVLAGRLPPDELAALAELLSAAFDRAAIARAAGADPAPYRQALTRLIAGVTSDRPPDRQAPV